MLERHVKISTQEEHTKRYLIFWEINCRELNEGSLLVQWLTT